MDWSALVDNWNWFTLAEILGVNIVLSGDNAVLIALAAAGLPAHQRGKAIMFGMVAAVVLRIILSVAAVQLLEIPGLLLVGGLLLLWIAWTFFRELRSEDKAEGEGRREAEQKTLMTALWQIVVADVSMSLDNVLAVAGAAHGNLEMLILGLAISILLMGVAATLISKLLERYRWIAYLGVVLIVWIGVKMVWEDVHRLGLLGEAHAAALQQRPALVQAAPAAPALLPQG